MQITDQKLGPETDTKVTIAGGNLIISTAYTGKETQVQNTITCGVALLITELEAKVTNPMEKAALEMVASLITGIS